MNSKSTPLQDLGFANGWGAEPLIVQKCKEIGHKPPHDPVGSPNRGLTEVKCDLCGYVYRYDSSD